MSSNIGTVIALYSPTIWATCPIWAMLVISPPICESILAGGGSGSLPSRYQIHGVYIPKHYAALAVATVTYFAMIWAATVISPAYGSASTQSNLNSFTIGGKRSVDPRNARSEVLGIVLGL
ncbi:hypothetical protein LA080_008341 [Diaporthe eres]|nr:hypothetical protein LA080_008341 [Diaporthe eres]